jgi:hypothetical protein
MPLSLLKYMNNDVLTVICPAMLRVVRILTQIVTSSFVITLKPNIQVVLSQAKPCRFVSLYVLHRALHWKYNCEGFSCHSYFCLYPVTYIISLTCLQVYFTERCTYQSSTHSAYQTDLLIFFVKTRILYLSPQALIKNKIAASNKRVWSYFIYCTDDCCFKIELRNSWWPWNTPVLRRS